MSIRNKRIASPVKKYIEYRASTSTKGKGGTFFYYDKETKENIDFALPISFIDVGVYSKIVGWSDENKAAIYSNEILSTKTPFVVKYSKKGTMCTGLYKDIKDMIKSSGGRFALSIYAILNDEVVNITLKGKAMSAWIEREQGDSVIVASTVTESKGATSFEVPVFKAQELSIEELDKISVEHASLFAYLDAKDAMLSTGEDDSNEMIQMANEGSYDQTAHGPYGFQGLTEDELSIKVDNYKAGNKEKYDEDEINIEDVPF